MSPIPRSCNTFPPAGYTTSRRRKISPPFGGEEGYHWGFTLCTHPRGATTGACSLRRRASNVILRVLHNKKATHTYIQVRIYLHTPDGKRAILSKCKTVVCSRSCVCNLRQTARCKSTPFTAVAEACGHLIMGVTLSCVKAGMVYFHRGALFTIGLFYYHRTLYPVYTYLQPIAKIQRCQNYSAIQSAFLFFL